MASTQKARCPTFVHISGSPPKRYCPSCGELVNRANPEKRCTPHYQAIKRAQRNRFLVETP